MRPPAELLTYYQLPASVPTTTIEELRGSATKAELGHVIINNIIIVQIPIGGDR